MNTQPYGHPTDSEIEAARRLGMDPWEVKYVMDVWEQSYSDLEEPDLVNLRKVYAVEWDNERALWGVRQPGGPFLSHWGHRSDAKRALRRKMYGWPV